MIGAAGYFLETRRVNDPAALAGVVGRLLQIEGDILGVAEELTSRYEEIDLLYTISEVLGRTIGLQEAAETIVREVSSVVGARRASIFVTDETRRFLEPVAGWGLDVGEFGPIPIDHPHSVAARVFRENATIAGNAADLNPDRETPPRQQAYRGTSFLAAPITYPDPDGVPRPVGVINLTDRLGHDAFSSGDRKLVGAIAHQVGAAVENARLVALDRQRQRVRRELELAHDLQLRILPHPTLWAGRADLAARCAPGELVGGDFYQFVPLSGSRVGVMLGDVSTHGFPAALIMAMVLSAAGIHATAADSPENALQRLLESEQSELATTEMYLSLCYAVIDRRARRLRYANAGHPHAFLLAPGRSPRRLGATCPPLGLGGTAPIPGEDVAPVNPGDLVVMFSDGIPDAGDDVGQRFGEARTLELIGRLRERPTPEIVDRVFAAVSAFASNAPDDQTLLVLRV